MITLNDAIDRINLVFGEDWQGHRLTKPIEIMVVGATHTGKTLVSSIIEKALRDAGFGSVSVKNAEETTTAREEMVVNLARNRADEVTGGGDESLKQFLTKPITIQEVSAPKPQRGILNRVSD